MSDSKCKEESSILSERGSKNGDQPAAADIVCNCDPGDVVPLFVDGAVADGATANTVTAAGGPRAAGTAVVAGGRGGGRRCEGHGRGHGQGSCGHGGGSGRFHQGERGHF